MPKLTITPPGDLPPAQGDAATNPNPGPVEDPPPWEEPPLNERPVDLRERFAEATPLRKLVDLIIRLNRQWLALSGHGFNAELAAIEAELDQLAVSFSGNDDDDEEERLSADARAAGEEIDRILHEAKELPSRELLRRYGVPESDIDNELERMGLNVKHREARHEIDRLVEAGELPGRELCMAAGCDPDLLLSKIQATFDWRKQVNERDIAEAAEKQRLADAEREGLETAASIKQLVDDNSGPDLLKLGQTEGAAVKAGDSKPLMAQAIHENRKAKAAA